MDGKVIVIEGLDGSGKTTQWEMLKQSMKKASFITFPNYKSDSGRIISRYLSGDFQSEDSAEHSAYSASSFYAIDRYISYKDSWKSIFTSGTNIITARYTTSNAIYQMPKLPENKWDEYHNWLCDYEYTKLGIPKPYLTIFLDVPIEISQELLNKRYNSSGEKDIHEADVAYLQICRHAALYAAEKEGWITVDCVDSDSKTPALKTPETINRELVKIIEKHLEGT